MVGAITETLKDFFRFLRLKGSLLSNTLTAVNNEFLAK